MSLFNNITKSSWLLCMYRRIVTVRDLLAWVEFICHTTNDGGTEVLSESLVIHSVRRLSLSASYVHGACIVFVDALAASGHLVCCVFSPFLIFRFHAADSYHCIF